MHSNFRQNPNNETEWTKRTRQPWLLVHWDTNAQVKPTHRILDWTESYGINTTAKVSSEVDHGGRRKWKREWRTTNYATNCTTLRQRMDIINTTNNTNTPGELTTRLHTKTKQPPYTENKPTPTQLCWMELRNTNEQDKLTHKAEGRRGHVKMTQKQMKARTRNTKLHHKQQQFRTRQQTKQRQSIN